MTDTATELKLLAGKAAALSRLSRNTVRFQLWDLATAVLIAALALTAFVTLPDYAISNDEIVQHHYGELIVAYYASGLKDRAVFEFQNLYLYGGLFDVLAVLVNRVIPIDPFALRHALCAITGLAGITAAAAAARKIAGPRAGLLAALALAVCGVWYGAIFNHTKDIPFAAAMIGATVFLLRIGPTLPRPRAADVAAFGLLAGVALGMRVFGLLLFIYAGLLLLLYLPRRPAGLQAALRWLAASGLRLLPALAIAWIIMVLSWPWAALSILNPLRGLVAFSEFQFEIRTLLAGKSYDMAEAPRWYETAYFLVRMPVIVLAGTALAAMTLLVPPRLSGWSAVKRSATFLLAFTVVFPLACQAIWHGPAFTGLRHFLFVVPSLAVLAAIGMDDVIGRAGRSRLALVAAGAVIVAGYLWPATILVRLHPYEYLFYNGFAGGLAGASRRYDLDYWFNSMPEALRKLEAYVRKTIPAGDPTVYSVAVCGERVAFEKKVTVPQLRYDFKPQWSQSEFFIAPTHMNCDLDLDGEIVATVERLGVPIAVVKDRRQLVRGGGE